MENSAFDHFLAFTSNFETKEAQQNLTADSRKSIYEIAKFIDCEEVARELWKDLPEEASIKEDELDPDSDEDTKFGLFCENFRDGLYWKSPNGKFFLHSAREDEGYIIEVDGTDSYMWMIANEDPVLLTVDEGGGSYVDWKLDKIS